MRTLPKLTTREVAPCEATPASATGALADGARAMPRVKVSLRARMGCRGARQPVPVLVVVALTCLLGPESMEGTRSRKAPVE